MIHKPGCSALSKPSGVTADYVRTMALSLFVDRGFERVSVRELASAIKVQAGSLYNHIESKQSLLYDLIEEHESGLLHTLNQCKNACRTPSAALNSYIEAYVLFQLNNQQTAALARLEIRSLSVDQQNSIKKFRAFYQSYFEEVITSLSKFNALDNLEVKIAAQGLLEMLNGLAIALSSSPRAHKADHLIERIQAILLKAIAGDLPEKSLSSPSSNQTRATQFRIKPTPNKDTLRKANA